MRKSFSPETIARIKALRKNSGLTNSQLALRFGVSRSTIGEVFSPRQKKVKKNSAQ